MSEERRKASNDRSVSGFRRIPDGQRRRGEEGLSNALQAVSPRCERGQAGRRAGRKRNSWKFSRRMRRSCTAGRAAASARAAAITAARSSSASRSMTTRLPRFGALTAEIPTAMRATADMARRGRMIPSRCARRRTTSTPATMPGAQRAGQRAPGKRNARWYFLSALAQSGLHNNAQAMEYARQAASMEPGNMQYQQLLSQLQGGGSWYNQGAGIRPQNRQHEQRLHDHPDAEPVLRLLRRRSDDVLSDVLLHLSGLKKTSRKRRKSVGFCLHSAMKSAIIKARRKGFVV